MPCDLKWLGANKYACSTKINNSLHLPVKNNKLFTAMRLQPYNEIFSEIDNSLSVCNSQ